MALQLNANDNYYKSSVIIHVAFFRKTMRRHLLIEKYSNVLIASRTAK